jgi:hypothetical protein
MRRREEGGGRRDEKRGGEDWAPPGSLYMRRRVLTSHTYTLWQLDPAVTFAPVLKARRQKEASGIRTNPSGVISGRLTILKAGHQTETFGKMNKPSVVIYKPSGVILGSMTILFTRSPGIERSSFIDGPYLVNVPCRVVSCQNE